MSTDAIMSYISECSRAGRLEFQVSIQCAPVLKGIKASNLVTMAKGSLQTVRSALAGTEITAAVSYTHLDVYKRQSMVSAERAERRRSALRRRTGFFTRIRMQMHCFRMQMWILYT